MPKDLADSRLEQARQAIKNKETVFFEDVRAGRYMENYYVPVPTSGEKRTFQVIARDVTKRRQAEEALRESEEKYRTVLESNPDPVVVYDMEGKVTYFNPAFTRVFGWSLEEQLGKKIDTFVPEENWPETKKMINKLTVLGESFYGLETRRYTKQGSILNIMISGSSYRDHEGNVVASVINLRDITEKKRLEDQLQQAQKMEAIGTLAGGVAHDLNNILGGLVSYPELLLLQLPEDSPLRKSILTIQKSGEKAAAVVQDLLTLARRGVVVTEVVNLNDVISEYLKSPEHENLLSYHPGIQIETRLEKDTLNILGSSTHLSKTVMNLISNAAEAMPVGGELTVTTENRYIDRPIRGYEAVKEGDYVVLTISDTGTGISQDDIKKIFEPFYTKKKMGRSGTGLGMAVVWGTVKDHNGYIDVQSIERKGTTFTLYFPVTRKKLPEDEASLPIESYSGNGESILIVDDVEEQRKIASGMLKELGYSVLSVSSGEEAVEYLKTNKVVLLVLDMIMDPGMDGLDTYKKIIEIHPGQKAIIASGFS
ncbi:MAG: PAS domain S-box protein, partial [Deltaproteobacteria bacterium]|nr:PAS domain S-box protein [Deltaproteobacteria bacterium]